MSIVSLLGINVLNNPAPFTSPYEFEITFECLEPLREDLEWKLTYVGSSTSFEHDQVLDSILVGPIPVGVNKFLFNAEAPSPDLIPAGELVSVTVILLTCSYADREFVRVGYYVNNEYDSEELRLNPPPKVQIEHVVRNVLAEKPRVTKFNIKWDSEEGAPSEFPPEQPDADAADDDEEAYGEDDGEDDDEEEPEGEDAGPEPDHEAEQDGEEMDEDDEEEEEEDDDDDGVEVEDDEASGDKENSLPSVDDDKKK
ncbi:uncharacterized protein V1510DRAFT_437497 [Dipodascopsis tothii]|uniref:uncharacterized protein n=1 Tax=Dipodascopsis tothii TaxID=44089 RepID=UPI0034CE5E10